MREMESQSISAIFYILVNRCTGTVHDTSHLRNVDVIGLIHLIILPKLSGRLEEESEKIVNNLDE